HLNNANHLLPTPYIQQEQQAPLLVDCQRPGAFAVTLESMHPECMDRLQLLEITGGLNDAYPLNVTVSDRFWPAPQGPGMLFETQPVLVVPELQLHLNTYSPQR